MTDQAKPGDSVAFEEARAKTISEVGAELEPYLRKLVELYPLAPCHEQAEECINITSKSLAMVFWDLWVQLAAGALVCPPSPDESVH